MAREATATAWEAVDEFEAAFKNKRLAFADDELYPQLHRSIDGGPRQAHDIAARATVLSSGQAVRVPWKHSQL